MNIDHPAKTVLITGGPGTGKTTLAEELLREQRARLKFVYDPEEEFCIRFDIDPVRTPEQILDKTARGGWVVYVPSEDDWEDFGYGTEDRPGGFQFFCEFVLTQVKVLKGTKLFYCDEVDTLTNTDNFPRYLVALLQLGRRRETDCFIVGGQANRFHNALRAKVTQIYTFTQPDQTAIQWLVKNGIPEETIRGLGEHGWAFRNLRTGETSTNVKKHDNEQPASKTA